MANSMNTMHIIFVLIAISSFPLREVTVCATINKALVPDAQTCRPDLAAPVCPLLAGWRHTGLFSVTLSSFS
jgi:hypothetical protein